MESQSNKTKKKNQRKEEHNIRNKSNQKGVS